MAIQKRRTNASASEAFQHAVGDHGSNSSPATTPRIPREKLKDKIDNGFGKSKYANEEDDKGRDTETTMNRPLQAMFALILIGPQVALFASQRVSPTPLEQLEQWARSSVVTTGLGPTFWLCVAALAFERVAYTIVWFVPERFVAICNKRPFKTFAGGPLDAMVKIFSISKLLQVGSYVVFWLSLEFADSSGLSLSNAYEHIVGHFSNSVTLYQAVTGTQLIVIGQLLNASIYWAIGKAGVYYGCKFGYHIPWCTGFPFNVFTAHPQYFGATATVLGAVVLFTSPAAEAGGWWALAAVQVLMYVYMSFVEGHL